MRIRLLLAAMAVFCSASAQSAQEARILRFPDVHEDRVAFVYAGDIWIGPSAGGEASRLTTHVGMETFPKFSPDGRFIAFSAEYSGSRQIWVVSVDGGAPRQLTFYNDVGVMPPRGGFDYRVLDWTPDGEQILFRANRLPWGVRMGRPYLVPFAGGMEVPLAVPEGGGGMLSPDGTKLVYTPIDREFRTWKRHRGGRAQDVWIYDLDNDTSERLTDYVGTDNQPLWVGDTIYFTSDREAGRLNLFAQDMGSGTARAVTRHDDFDVLWPSAGPRQIVYESGGYLYLFDPGTGESRRIPLRVTSDALYVVPTFKNVAEWIGGGDVSPTGQRAVFDARGDIFTVPAKNGEPRNLTRTQGVRETAPAWSPDGAWIAYLSDATGEYELWVEAQDGSGEPRQLTSGNATWIFDPVWSPDSKMLAFGDKEQRLRYVEVGSGRVVTADTSSTNDITTYRWSPDSRWLVYTRQDDSAFSSIFAYELASKRVHRLTDGFTNDYEPVFDPQGRYLYFLSDRDYDLTFAGYEFDYFYTDPTRVYAALLSADGEALLRPKSDEETPGANPEESDEEAEDEGDEVTPVAIDVAGFAQRVTALPAPAGAYHSLAASADAVYFVDANDSKLERFSLADEEVKTVLEGVDRYALSHDGKKVLYNQGETFGMVDAEPGQSAGDGALDLSGLVMKIDPMAEWRQIFVDGWRTTRDWFYDPGMHGLDWQEIRELYEPWVEHVRHRGDLDYILGEMGGELNAGHFYVNWGDMPRPERREGGLLGAEIVAHPSGYFEIAAILPGENWHDDFRSPLTGPGVDIAEGDLILAVDGRDASEVKNFYQLLEGAANRQVKLTVNSSPNLDGAREVTVRPTNRETNLRYLQWVEERRRMADEMSGGRIGYIHLPNTAFEGNRELRKFFYPQAHKDALIFDARYNGGGFIPGPMIELLTRTRLSSWARRGIEPFHTPGYSHDGPKACLMNGYSSSGGDAFPYYFRKMELGPLIGTRTWGGLIGISGNPGFMDGGSLSVPTFRFYDTDGQWAVENEGVAPDIEVVDRPELVAQGEDPTLAKAIEVLLAELERNPPAEIAVPEPPRYER